MWPDFRRKAAMKKAKVDHANDQTNIPDEEEVRVSTMSLLSASTSPILSPR